MDSKVENIHGLLCHPQQLLSARASLAPCRDCPVPHGGNVPVSVQVGHSCWEPQAGRKLSISLGVMVFFSINIIPWCKHQLHVQGLLAVASSSHWWILATSLLMGALSVCHGSSGSIPLRLLWSSIQYFINHLKGIIKSLPASFITALICEVSQGNKY